MGAIPRSSRHSRTPFTRLRRFGETLEPAGAIREPPTEGEDWYCGAQRPPHRQNKIGSQTKHREREPEHLSFHGSSLQARLLAISPDRSLAQIPPDVKSFYVNLGITVIGLADQASIPIAVNIDIQIERWSLERLVPWANNPRTHSGEQVAQIAASMREWGWKNPILVGAEDEIIAGHARLLAAKSLA